MSKYKEEVRFYQKCVLGLVCILGAVLLFINRETFLAPNEGDCFFNKDSGAMAKVISVESTTVYYRFLSTFDLDYYGIEYDWKGRSILSFNERYPTKANCSIFQLLYNVALNIKTREIEIHNLVKRIGRIEESAILPVVEKKDE